MDAKQSGTDAGAGPGSSAHDDDSGGRLRGESRMHTAAMAVARAMDGVVEEYELRHDHVMAALEVLRDRQKAGEDRLKQIEYEQGEINRGVASVIQNQQGGAARFKELTGSLTRLGEGQDAARAKLDAMVERVERLQRLLAIVIIVALAAAALAGWGAWTISQGG